jgi:site-specific recombinase XerC
MAVNRKEFVNIIKTGLRADKNFKRFHYRFQKNGTETEKVLDFSDKTWNKTERIKQAEDALSKAKDNAINDKCEFNENSTLNFIADIYFQNITESKWNQERKDIYNLYCRGDEVKTKNSKTIRPKYDGIGKIKIGAIRKTHIDGLRKSMESMGFTKQNSDGCSPRTIQKVLNQVLKPILLLAVDNNVLTNIPKIELPKRKRKVKTVSDGTNKFITLYNSIMNLYADEPLYRALFLFALDGRRLNEILTLDWKDIDLSSRSYTIAAENNKIGENQTYFLPDFISKALVEIEDDQKGLVFKSPKTGNKLTSPKRQLSRLQIEANMPELTMHYFRHIRVTMGGELGLSAIVLSASLGHNNVKTVDDFYRTSNHLLASKQMNQVIEGVIK